MVMANEVMRKGKEVKLHDGTKEMAGEENKEEKAAQRLQNAEVGDAERGNCGEMASRKEDVGGNTPGKEDLGEKPVTKEDLGRKLAGKEDLGGKSAVGEDLDGDESDPLPPPVVRDGRRYLSIQR